MVKIAVFDSGFGSLSVIKQIRKKMKAEVIYFADQENFPYGKKSVAELRRIINKTISTLKKEFKPDVIVVGSNTPSILLGGYKLSKIIGVYPPLKEASKKTKTSSIAILSTQNVVKSKALDDLIRKNVSKKVKVLKINVSPLVELVESGKFIYQKQYCINKIKSLLLKPLEDNQVDVVTLSSTHLPFILPLLHQLFQKECSNLSIIVLNNLHRLKVNPKDSIAIEKMLQAADTMIGDSRFINLKEFEQASMLLVETFYRAEDLTEKSKEIEFFIDIFTKIIKH